MAESEERDFESNPFFEAGFNPKELEERFRQTQYENAQRAVREAALLVEHEEIQEQYQQQSEIIKQLQVCELMLLPSC